MPTKRGGYFNAAHWHNIWKHLSAKNHKFIYLVNKEDPTKLYRVNLESQQPCVKMGTHKGDACLKVKLGHDDDGYVCDAEHFNRDSGKSGKWEDSSACLMVKKYNIAKKNRGNLQVLSLDGDGDVVAGDTFKYRKGIVV